VRNLNSIHSQLVASTIFRHREENGRTYHKFRGGEKEYWGPNDDKQNDQLDIAHRMLTLLLDNKLYLAPIDEHCQRTLDVGCGTGIWAMDFAHAHPSLVPPNCQFEIEDWESESTYEKDAFDFIHVRCLFGAISDWPKLNREIYAHTKTGGWIQHLDMSIDFTSDDGTVGPDHIIAEWSRTFIEAGDKMGKTFRIADNASRLIRQACFTDVQESWCKMPVGSWSQDKKTRELGRWNLLYCFQDREG
jgi:SAM-dependent methyltransferase